MPDRMNRFVSNTLFRGMNNSYRPFLPVTMRLKAGTVFIMSPALSVVLTLTAVVKAIKVRIKNINTINGLAAGYPYPCSSPVRAVSFNP
jgi:hypothetical protein